MSLIRLLTSGKSLVGLQDSESRYRMRARNLLPKFGFTKNPFLARPVTARPAPAPLATPQVPAAPVSLAPEEMAAASLKETKRLPMAATTPTAAPGSLEPEGMSALLAPVKQWAGKLNPFKGRPRQPRAAKPAIPAFNRPPVQGELSLDNIKVMRNDLTDADVEIVTSKLPAKTKSAPAPVRQVKNPAELASAEPN